MNRAAVLAQSMKNVWLHNKLKPLLTQWSDELSHAELEELAAILDRWDSGTTVEAIMAQGEVLRETVRFLAGRFKSEELSSILTSSAMQEPANKGD